MWIKTLLTAFSFSLFAQFFPVEIAAANPSLEYLNHILKESEGNLDKNYKRLSSGTRLLVDDPASYAIYARLEAQVRGLAKEINNNKDIISYYSFGEALLGNIIDVLQRIRELLIGKGNTIFSREDLSFLDAEIAAQYDQIMFVLESAELNEISVFGSFFSDVLFSGLFTKEPYFEIKNVDNMLEFMTSQRSIYGAKMNQLEHRTKSQAVERENSESFQSTILDIDYGAELSLLAKNELLLLSHILLLRME